MDDAGSQPLLVYFSSTSENTHRFVGRLGYPTARIPLRRTEAPLRVDREYVLVVPTSGNTNFGKAYGIAGDIIASKVGVPFLYRYELLGTPSDVERVKQGLDKFWQTL